jgi:hypothetical protein
LKAEDFDGFINYWLGLSQAEIERLGVAIDRVPSAARMRSDLEAMLLAPNDGVRSFVLAWCINDEAIGHSSLKDIVPGNLGSMHLHMWRADLRGKGHGPASMPRGMPAAACSSSLRLQPKVCRRPLRSIVRYSMRMLRATRCAIISPAKRRLPIVLRRATRLLTKWRCERRARVRRVPADLTRDSGGVPLELGIHKTSNVERQYVTRISWQSIQMFFDISSKYMKTPDVLWCQVSI